MEEIREDGKLHSITNPARVTYYDSGKVKTKEFFILGKRHRTTGPAYVRFNENNDGYVEEWYENDKLHRICGPAISHYDKDLVLVYSGYYNDGVKKKTYR